MGVAGGDVARAYLEALEEDDVNEKDGARGECEKLCFEGQ
jgi:hypothetical protein